MSMPETPTCSLIRGDGIGPEIADATLRALDAAGGWGALWLEARGDLPRARRSLSYTVNAFVAKQASLSGYRPYLDPVDGPATPLDTDLIFVEGSLGVALAAHRQLAQARVHVGAAQARVGAQASMLRAHRDHHVGPEPHVPGSRRRHRIRRACRPDPPR